MEILDYTSELKAEEGRGEVSIRLAEVFRTYLAPEVLAELSETYEDGPLEYIQELSINCTHAFIAVAGETDIVGAVFINEMPEHNPPCLFISALFTEVDPDYPHNCDAQEEILNHVIEFARAAGSQSLCAWAISNEEHTLYSGAGFVQYDNDDPEAYTLNPALRI